MKEILVKLSAVANALDERGYVVEADAITGVMSKIANYGAMRDPDSFSRMQPSNDSSDHYDNLRQLQGDAQNDSVSEILARVQRHEMTIEEAQALLEKEFGDPDLIDFDTMTM